MRSMRHLRRYMRFNTILKDDHRMYQKERCMGCGPRVDHCPEKAIKSYADPEKPQPPI
ncbi:MAG: hypothetical protein R2861_00625 [Desulfobacterales bacterium]